MKLSPITSHHIIAATNQIDNEGIPNNYAWNNYFVVIDNKEYPFKHLVRVAYKIATGANLIHFQSNYTYRRYIENLGFEFVNYKEGNIVDAAENLSKIARITWNENKWQKPSGSNGKTKNPSFEAENGFGHEEWIFDGDTVIDGYKYAFLEPIHKYHKTYQGKTFDISLYTRNADTKESFWVTTLHDVEVISREEAKTVLKIYKENGWYKSMQEDLNNLKIEGDKLDDWSMDNPAALFNVKFKANQLNEISENLIPIENPEDISSGRYTLLNISNQIKEKYETEPTGFDFENSGSIKPNFKKSSKRRMKQREIELVLKHNNLQKDFVKYLQAEYGVEKVKLECKAYGQNRIDITRKTDTGFVFYEVKTFNSLKTSIREGIGQLLEYALFPSVEEAEEIVLVSHVAPNAQLVDYLEHIKLFIKIPFSYLHFDLEKQEVVKHI